MLVLPPESIAARAPAPITPTATILAVLSPAAVVVAAVVAVVAAVPLPMAPEHVGQGAVPEAVPEPMAAASYISSPAKAGALRTMLTNIANIIFFINCYSII